jgi:hypothetical protein
MRIERHHGLACDFDDAVDALEFWRGRRSRLAWHKRRARREADAMVDAWERRVRWATLTDPALPFARRLEAGVLVLRTRGAIVGRRWRMRAYAVGLTMAAVAGMGFAAITSLF